MREKEQDRLFEGACPMLVQKKLTLKVYGFNVLQIDRNIDVNAGGVLFRPVGNSELTTPAIVLALLRAEKPTKKS